MRRVMTSAALAVLLASCGGDEPTAEARSAASKTPAAAAAPAPVAAPTGTVTIRPATGDAITVNESPDGVIDIAYTAEGEKRVLRGTPRETGKRKYQIGSSPVMFEVKPGDDDGFKLRMADGKLRWKVKVSADKIKISDNEQNANAFELKPRDGGRVKVEAPGGRELGNVRGNDVEDASGKKLYTVDGPAGSAAYGVLLLDGIPDTQRYILVAELLGRKR